MIVVFFWVGVGNSYYVGTKIAERGTFELIYYDC